MNRTVRLLSVLLLLVSFTFAGPNRDATVFVDYIAGDEGIDSTPPSIVQGRSMLAAVWIRNVKDLDTYSFSVAYDTASLLFVKAVPAVTPGGAFLESNGGKMVGFFVKESARGRIEVAASLAGKDRAQAPDGDGTLCVLAFTAKNGGKTGLHIDTIIILDSEQVEDRPAGT